MAEKRMSIAALRPSVLFELLAKCLYACLQFRIGLGAAHQHANPPHPLGLLRSRRKRTRRPGAEEREEIAPFQLIELHSIPASQGRIAGYRTGGK
jgi:hypothetical protein